jgi:RNA polymerase sigma-70 factor (ECF subfamily)
MISFHDLYKNYAPEIYRFAFWLAGNADDADDITSETFTRAWTSKAKIRTETVKAYLFTIARNYYLEQQRRAKTRVELTPDYIDPTPSPAELVETRLNLQAVLKTVQDLPEANRTAFVLRVQHQLPYDEVARVMNLSLSAVKVKVHRVRLKLAAQHLNEETKL